MYASQSHGKNQQVKTVLIIMPVQTFPRFMRVRVLAEQLGNALVPLQMPLALPLPLPREGDYSEVIVYVCVSFIVSIVMFFIKS